jgi:hypothetical protein
MDRTLPRWAAALILLTVLHESGKCPDSSLFHRLQGGNAASEVSDAAL